MSRLEIAGRRPRLPGLLYSVITAVVMLALGVAALTARQTPPPSIAEFAPQAVEQITQAPTEQGASAGAGSLAETGRGSPAPDRPQTPADVIDIPRVKRCVGDPPRQIEDPQSPPCIPYWDGDNQGATSRGVTASEIRIVIPDIEAAYQQDVVRFINKRFELYGRKITAFPRPPAYTAPCGGRRAQAIGYAQTEQAFATLTFNSDNEQCFIDEAARQKLIVSAWGHYYDEAGLAARSPYAWQYAMAFDGITRLVGRMVCRRLAGQAARHGEGLTGSPPRSITTTPRKFGAIVQDNGREQQFDLGSLRQELASCGEHLEPVYYFPTREGTTDPSQSRNAILQMQTAGVTSIICLCGGFYALHLPSSASEQGYYPEWIFSTYGDNDNPTNVKIFFPGADQRGNILGLTVRPPPVPFENEPAVWAAREMNPSYAPSRQSGAAWASLYKSLLLLASGFQMAGPHLTPESFEAGLQRTVFPNPETALKAGSVGFKGDHTMTDDAAEFWWSETAPSPAGDDSPGMFCYLGGGARATNWPRSDPDPFFTVPCFAPRG